MKTETTYHSSALSSLASSLIFIPSALFKFRKSCLESKKSGTAKPRRIETLAILKYWDFHVTSREKEAKAAARPVIFNASTVPHGCGVKYSYSNNKLMRRDVT